MWTENIVERRFSLRHDKSEPRPDGARAYACHTILSPDVGNPKEDIAQKGYFPSKLMLFSQSERRRF